MTEISYPIRVNKFLAYRGLCSRRQADRFVKEGSVLINGKPAELGQKVQEGDTVELADEVSKHSDNYRYVLFNKPRGVVSHTPNESEKGVRDFFNPDEATLSPVGRLDKDSEGLMLLTNDGRIVNPILHPDHEHEKEYEVTVNKPIDPNFISQISSGVDIEGYTTKNAQARMTGKQSFRIILTEGKHHQIRRMVTALGYEVESLQRARIMHLELGKLQPGNARELSNQEKEELFKKLDIKE